MMIITNDSDYDDNKNTTSDDDKNNDNKLAAYSPDKGPIMLKFGVTFFF